MLEPIFLYSEVVVHWGFVVRQAGASAAQSAYILPPPTTVVGAFANPLARVIGIPDAIDLKRRMPVSNKVMECALKSTLAASAGLLPSQEGTGIVAFEEPSRIMGTPYKGGGSYDSAVKKPIYESVQELLPVQAMGSTTAPKVSLGIAWLFDKKTLELCLNHDLSYVILEEAAFNIYRIGSREGLVSLVGAPKIYLGGDVEVRELGSFRSLLYQNAECASPKYITDVVEVTLLDTGYRETRYYAPASLGSGPSILLPPPEPVLFSLRSKCKVAYPRERRELALVFRRGV